MTGRTLALTCLLFAAPLFGQERRLVSRIEVAGNAPAQLVVSQTAIEAGRSYSDRDLEVAIARIRRLPFVYDARYSLDGDTLSIEVDTVTRFSANIAVSASSFPDEVSGQGDIGGGARFFAGSGGVARVTVNKFLAEGGDFRTLAADYSHYGIGGTRLFANAAIGKTFDGDDDFEPDPDRKSV